MDIKHHLWQEKYRPDSVKKMVLPKELKQFFLKIIEDGILPHLILHSRNPGSGKSSLSKAICSDLGIDDYLYINASLDAGIDALRTDILQYVSSASISGNRKVVILDDMGSNTRAFQEALKVFIEQYSKNTSFIITTNNINIIDEKIQSRCKIKDFNFSSPQEKQEIFKIIVARFKKMLEIEKVEYTESTLVAVCEKYYPDIRRMTGALQDMFTTYGKIPENVPFTDEKQNAQLFDLLFKRDIVGCRKFVIENGYIISEMYSLLFRDFVPLIKSPEVQNQVILILCKYMDFNSRSIDFELTFSGCMIEIIGKLK